MFICCVGVKLISWHLDKCESQPIIKAIYLHAAAAQHGQQPEAIAAPRGLGVIFRGWYHVMHDYPFGAMSYRIVKISQDKIKIMASVNEYHIKFDLGRQL